VPTPEQSVAPAPGQHEERAMRPWLVRWCGLCRQWERDTGAPLGWVRVRFLHERREESHGLQS
jgi:hypothetical protein